MTDIKPEVVEPYWYVYHGSNDEKVIAATDIIPTKCGNKQDVEAWCFLVDDVENPDWILVMGYDTNHVYGDEPLEQYYWKE